MQGKESKKKRYKRLKEGGQEIHFLVSSDVSVVLSLEQKRYRRRGGEGSIIGSVSRCEKIG
jgi:hypothetical protein